MFDNTIKRDKNLREKKKTAAMFNGDESSEEQRPHDKFTKNITKENLPQSNVYKSVFSLQD